MSEWEEKYERELARGEQARRQGNEGMARVCARRAAGQVAGAYLGQRGAGVRSPSAYDQLKALCGLPDLPPEALAAANRLLLRVTTDYTLPVDADLLADARSLKQLLLGS